MAFLKPHVNTENMNINPQVNVNKSNLIKTRIYLKIYSVFTHCYPTQNYIFMGPGGFSQLSAQFLIYAQDMISGSQDRAPHEVWSLPGILSLSLCSSPSSCMCAHAHALLKKKITFSPRI